MTLHVVVFTGGGGAAVIAGTVAVGGNASCTAAVV